MRNPKKDNNKFTIKNNQNCQKIELYGSLTTKVLKKKYSSRLVGGAEMGKRNIGGVPLTRTPTKSNRQPFALWYDTQLAEPRWSELEQHAS